MPGNVLRRNASCPFVERSLIPPLFFRVHLALRIRKEISAIDAQNKHEEQLRIQPRGRNLIRAKEGDRGGKGLLELHESISPRRQRVSAKTNSQAASPYF